MTEPTFDADGYPTDETLEAIRTWPYKDADECLMFIKAAWNWPDMAAIKDGKLQLSTGGWSGNEDLIAALMGNRVVWLSRWLSSCRGGHYVFEMKT